MKATKGKMKVRIKKDEKVEEIEVSAVAEEKETDEKTEKLSN